jgi:hypothetical protein
MKSLDFIELVHVARGYYKSKTWKVKQATGKQSSDSKSSLSLLNESSFSIAAKACSFWPGDHFVATVRKIMSLWLLGSKKSHARWSFLVAKITKSLYRPVCHSQSLWSFGKKVLQRCWTIVIRWEKLTQPITAGENEISTLISWFVYIQTNILMAEF